MTEEEVKQLIASYHWTPKLNRKPSGTYLEAVRKRCGKTETKHIAALKKLPDISSAAIEKILTTYYQSPCVTLYHANFLATDAIKAASIDVIITSPPYNLDIAYRSYSDRLRHKDYLAFTEAWLKKSYVLLAPQGRLCMNLPLDTAKHGKQSMYSDVLAIAKAMGFHYHTTIIWQEDNISRRTAWGSWLSASAPNVIAPVEAILVMYKREWRRGNDSPSDITKEEFISWTLGLWKFPGESKNG